MKNLFKILKLAKDYPGFAFLNVFFNILSVFFSVFSLAMLIPVLDVLFSDNLEQLKTSSAPANYSADSLKDEFYNFLATTIQEQGKQEALIYICILLIIMTTLKNLFKYLGMFFIGKIRGNVVRDLRNRLYNKVLALPLAYFSEERKGNIISKMTSDVQEVEWSIMTSLEAVFREPISIIAFLAALVYTSPEMSVFIFILLPIAGLIIGQIGKSLKKTSSQSQNQLGNLLSTIEETLTGLRIIKGFNAEEKSSNRFETQNERYATLMKRMYHKRDLASPMSEWMGILVVSIVLLYGGGLVFDGSLEASSFIGFLALFSQLITPAKSLSSASYHVQRGSASMDRINDILTADNRIFEIEQPISLANFKEKVEYKNINFKYDKELVLKDLSLTINKGETVALVGPSGSGKSTIADLLPRFYDVENGAVLIDDINIKDLKVKDLRSLLGIVTQQSILFNDTVKNNIAFGEGSYSDEEIRKAAEIANAHEFIEQLEHGYETNIGDGGGKLSGGQRQRISIARAVLKNPPILILDEATSALDTQSEKLVQEALENLMKNRTSIVIAHRLSTIQNADKIVVIEKGTIKEMGTHEELIEKRALYKKLYDLQSFG
tara:strand:- start:950 stop:2770 length:1821 start_codon:yes stop_codon:yes gene_type:complete